MVLDITVLRDPSTGKTCFVHTTAITVKCRIIHAKYVLIVQNL